MEASSELFTGHLVGFLAIAGLDPAIHPFREKMDARVKLPAHDGGVINSRRAVLFRAG
jgi:hypothetical protein